MAKIFRSEDRFAFPALGHYTQGPAYTHCTRPYSRKKEAGVPKSPSNQNYAFWRDSVNIYKYLDERRTLRFNLCSHHSPNTHTPYFYRHFSRFWSDLNIRFCLTVSWFFVCLKFRPKDLKSRNVDRLMSACASGTPFVRVPKGQRRDSWPSLKYFKLTLTYQPKSTFSLSFNLESLLSNLCEVSIRRLTPKDPYSREVIRLKFDLSPEPFFSPCGTRYQADSPIRPKISLYNPGLLSRKRN